MGAGTGSTLVWPSPLQGTTNMQRKRNRYTMDHQSQMRLGRIGGMLKDRPITSTAPCRIDFGGTLDISSFHYPLRCRRPATVNLALDMRTRVRLEPCADGVVQVSSAGFDDAVFDAGAAPYDHPLGLMFAVTDYFGADGVHIQIQSTSPPKSGLGGSSVAAVALVNAFSKAGARQGRVELSRSAAALLAHAIEQGVAGVPCGIQDQLAAAFGGVNRWIWPAEPDHRPFVGRPLLDKQTLDRLNRRLVVAYLGVPHVSKDVNSTWIRQFAAGKDRARWHEIIDLVGVFADALSRLDMPAAADAMNRETAVRKAMTPLVLDNLGDQLAAVALDCRCGARFTGAGGGGCMWALGEPDDLVRLTSAWDHLLAQRATARILDCRVDHRGVQ